MTEMTIRLNEIENSMKAELFLDAFDALNDLFNDVCDKRVSYTDNENSRFMTYLYECAEQLYPDRIAH